MTFRKTSHLLAASSLSLLLAGCKVDNRPLLAWLGRPAPAVDAGLVQPGALGEPYPVAYAANPAPARAYPYAQRARALDRTFYRARPTYAFAYADEEPWAWEAADQSLMFAEPYGDAYRFYYYEPGAPYPYFVRDADYGYALGPNGSLLALFDAAGLLLGPADYPRYYPAARQYWGRGYDLHNAYRRAPRAPVDRGLWAARAPVLDRVERPWISGFARHDEERHLGWTRGRHEGWDRPAPQFARPATRPEPRPHSGPHAGEIRMAQAAAPMAPGPGGGREAHGGSHGPTGQGGPAKGGGERHGGGGPGGGHKDGQGGHGGHDHGRGR